MKRVKCKSGIEGYQCRLQENYTSLEEFIQYSETFGLHKKLGYETPEKAWNDNPVIQGSVNPSDFIKIK